MRFKYLGSLVIIGLLGAAPLHAQNAAAPAGAADEANMQILRDKVKADKKLVVAANMTLTDAEAKAFWPIYDEYQKDLAGINQRTLKVIADYAAAYKAGPVADSTAKRLMDESLAIEQAEVALRQSYVPKLGKALPAGKVARYLQIESKIRAVIKYDLASQIQLVE
ncbi:MAG TPA: hypothetical protein VMJ30_08545 [Gemmatimonadales bacterium]|nr:hypothetical protein [Gemmatimonadales bacterium]